MRRDNDDNYMYRVLYTAVLGLAVGDWKTRDQLPALTLALTSLSLNSPAHWDKKQWYSLQMLISIFQSQAQF